LYFTGDEINSYLDTILGVKDDTADAKVDEVKGDTDGKGSIIVVGPSLCMSLLTSFLNLNFKRAVLLTYLKVSWGLQSSTLLNLSRGHRPFTNTIVWDILAKIFFEALNKCYAWFRCHRLQDSTLLEVRLIIFSWIVMYFECVILLWSIDWINSFINGGIIDGIITNDSTVDTAKVTTDTTIDATANKTVPSQVLSFIIFLCKVPAFLLLARVAASLAIFCVKANALTFAATAFYTALISGNRFLVGMFTITVKLLRAILRGIVRVTRVFDRKLIAYAVPNFFLFNIVSLISFGIVFLSLTDFTASYVLDELNHLFFGVTPHQAAPAVTPDQAAPAVNHTADDEINSYSDTILGVNDDTADVKVDEVKGDTDGNGSFIVVAFLMHVVAYIFFKS
jgi:hypothetical protein